MKHLHVWSQIKALAVTISKKYTTWLTRKTQRRHVSVVTGKSPQLLLACAGEEFLGSVPCCLRAPFPPPSAPSNTHAGFPPRLFYYLCWRDVRRVLVSVNACPQYGSVAFVEWKTVRCSNITVTCTLLSTRSIVEETLCESSSIPRVAAAEHYSLLVSFGVVRIM